MTCHAGGDWLARRGWPTTPRTERNTTRGEFGFQQPAPSPLAEGRPRRRGRQKLERFEKAHGENHERHERPDPEHERAAAGRGGADRRGAGPPRPVPVAAAVRILLYVLVLHLWEQAPANSAGRWP